MAMYMIIVSKLPNPKYRYGYDQILWKDPKEPLSRDKEGSKETLQEVKKDKQETEGSKEGLEGVHLK